jgi:hypothetical protein
LITYNQTLDRTKTIAAMSKQSGSNLLATTRAELVDDLAELRGIDRVNASLQWATEKYKDSDNQVRILHFILVFFFHSMLLQDV